MPSPSEVTDPDVMRMRDAKHAGHSARAYTPMPRSVAAITVPSWMLSFTDRVGLGITAPVGVAECVVFSLPEMHYLGRISRMSPNTSMHRVDLPRFNAARGVYEMMQLTWTDGEDRALDEMLDTARYDRSHADGRHDAHLPGLPLPTSAAGVCSVCGDPAEMYGAPLAARMQRNRAQFTLHTDRQPNDAHPIFCNIDRPNVTASAPNLRLWSEIPEDVTAPCQNCTTPIVTDGPLRAPTHVQTGSTICSIRFRPVSPPLVARA